MEKRFCSDEMRRQAAGDEIQKTLIIEVDWKFYVYLGLYKHSNFFFISLLLLVMMCDWWGWVNHSAQMQFLGTSSFSRQTRDGQAGDDDDYDATPSTRRCVHYGSLRWSRESQCWPHRLWFIIILIDNMRIPQDEMAGGGGCCWRKRRGRGEVERWNELTPQQPTYLLRASISPYCTEYTGILECCALYTHWTTREKKGRRTAEKCTRRLIIKATVYGIYES